MKCPSCGFESDLNRASKFCGNCGTPLQSVSRSGAARSVVTSRVSEPANVKLCSVGHTYAGDLLSCPQCVSAETVLDMPVISREVKIVEEPYTGAGQQSYIEEPYTVSQQPYVEEPVVNPIPVKAPVAGLPIAEGPRPADPQQIGERTTREIDSDRRGPAPGRKRLLGWLVSFDVDPSGADYPIRAGQRLYIGASSKCDIKLEDETVSSIHAIVVARDDGVFIKDELSTNGTYVNGRRIQEATRLSNYDQLRIGNLSLLFVQVFKGG